MHYGDSQALNASYLSLVVYKHSTDKSGVFDYVVSSIQDCQYVSPRFICKLDKQSNLIFKKLLKEHKAEEWYLIRFTNIKRSADNEFGWDYTITEILNVSDATNNLYHLH